MGDILDIHDLINSRYSLEVSSPGLDRPISRDKDFIKYKGSKVDIKTVQKIAGVKNFHGVLEDFTEESGKKVAHINVAGRTFRIPKDDIAKANLVAKV
jgi:ribosome maturation factor RimP